MWGRNGESDTANARRVHALQLLHGDVFGDARHAGSSAFHVFESINHNPVVGAVASRLHDDVAPEAHFFAKDLLLFLPGRGEGLILRISRKRKAIKWADDMHVRINRAFRHLKHKRIRVLILLDVRFNAWHRVIIRYAAHE